MCKGEELEDYFRREGGRVQYNRIVYIGDGSNDFCPLLRLTRCVHPSTFHLQNKQMAKKAYSNDLALVRYDYGLARRIAKEGKSAGMTVPVKYWDGAWEVELAFEELI